MSETVMTTGVMAPLKTPLSDEEREDIGEELYNLRSGLSINYEGTLLIQSETSDIYGFEWEGTSFYRGSLLGAIRKLPVELYERLDIHEEQSRNFKETWYNGGDSEHDMMTLEEFNK